MKIAIKIKVLLEGLEIAKESLGKQTVISATAGHQKFNQA